jgi:hypothetical protein
MISVVQKQWSLREDQLDYIQYALRLWALRGNHH